MLSLSAAHVTSGGPSLKHFMVATGTYLWQLTPSEIGCFVIPGIVGMIVSFLITAPLTIAMGKRHMMVASLLCA